MLRSTEALANLLVVQYQKQRDIKARDTLIRSGQRAVMTDKVDYLLNRCYSGTKAS